MLHDASSPDFDKQTFYTLKVIRHVIITALPEADHWIFRL